MKGERCALLEWIVTSTMGSCWSFCNGDSFDAQRRTPCLAFTSAVLAVDGPKEGT